jgi:hypothetical protein
MPIPGFLPDRREDARSATVFTIGKLTVDGRQMPCMVRDLSAGGMRIQMSEPPAPGARVLVEMRGLEPRLAEVVWVSGREAGLAFEQRCEPDEVFAARRNRAGKIARQPRFTLRRPAHILFDRDIVPAEIENISVGGARLSVAQPLEPGLRGVLHLPLGNRDAVAGEICWALGESCGFRFFEPVSSISLTLALREG